MIRDWSINDHNMFVGVFVALMREHPSFRDAAEVDLESAAGLAMRAIYETEAARSGKDVEEMLREDSERVFVEAMKAERDALN